MQNRMARERQRDYFEAAQDKAAGRDQVLLLFSSAAEVMQRVADYSKLPSAQNLEEMQDADGNFFFTFGYSEFGGGDVLR